MARRPASPKAARRAAMEHALAGVVVPDSREHQAAQKVAEAIAAGVVVPFGDREDGIRGTVGPYHEAVDRGARFAVFFDQRAWHKRGFMGPLATGEERGEVFTFRRPLDAAVKVVSEIGAANALKALGAKRRNPGGARQRARGARVWAQHTPIDGLTQAGRVRRRVARLRSKGERDYADRVLADGRWQSAMAAYRATSARRNPVITAKFPSTCGVCGARIGKGDSIEWTKGSPAVHARCAGAGASPGAASSPRSTCKCGNRLTPYEIRRGYQCQDCTRRDEGYGY